MAALTSFEGVAEGADLAIQVGSRMEHWRFGSDGLRTTVDERCEPLPLELFSGYLAEGLIYLRDMTPPQVREWFNSRSGNYHLVVLRVDGQTCHVGIFRMGEYSQITTRRTDQLLQDWRRGDPPQLSGSAMFQVMAQLEEVQREVKRLNEQAYNRAYLTDDLHGIQTYLDRAKSRLPNG